MHLQKNNVVSFSINEPTRRTRSGQGANSEVSYKIIIKKPTVVKKHLETPASSITQLAGHAPEVSG